MGTFTLFTIGHGAGTAESFVERCHTAGVEHVVDVRSAPGSRRHPRFGRAAFAVWLPDAGITYRWEQRLGGFRKPRADSVNVGLRHPAFRGYADYMDSADFSNALQEVLVAARAEPTAAMCSETLWWRCHRRLIADAAVLLHGAEVLHVDGTGKTAPHRVTDCARREGDVVRYFDADSLL